jgi:hypothetical protein
MMVVMLTCAAADGRHVIGSTPVPAAIIGSYGDHPVAWHVRPTGQPSWTNAEVPPWALGQGRYLVSTAWTYRCDAGGPLTHGIDCSNPARTSLVSAPEIDSYPAAVIPRAIGGIVQDYRRNYYAIFSEQTIGGRTLAVEHGETKNESIDGQLYQGTVDADPAACAFDTGGSQWERRLRLAPARRWGFQSTSQQMTAQIVAGELSCSVFVLGLCRGTPARGQ